MRLSKICLSFRRRSALDFAALALSGRVRDTCKKIGEEQRRTEIKKNKKNKKMNSRHAKRERLGGFNSNSLFERSDEKVFLTFSTV
jgi:hypothetical protein